MSNEDIDRAQQPLRDALADLQSEYRERAKRPRQSPRYDVSCKLGTVPALVRVHGRDTIAIGNVIRVKEGVGHKWIAVRVTDINDDGYFFADRW